MISNLQLKKVTGSDIQFLWELRNEPTVRKVSLNTEPIPLSEHRQWFLTKSASAKCHIFTITNNKGPEPIGQVRLDALPAGTAEISIALVKSQRGKGYGLKAINLIMIEAKKRGFKRVKARIKSFNEQSLKVFTAAGFKQTESHKIKENIDLIEMTRMI